MHLIALLQMKNSLGLAWGLAFNQNYLYSFKFVEGQFISMQIFIVINRQVELHEQQISNNVT